MVILRVFNIDIPFRNILFVVIEGCFIFLAIEMAAIIFTGSLDRSIFNSQILGKSLLIMGVCQLSFYYNELYNLRVTDTFIELGLRLTRALGVASIVLAIIYYMAPSLMIGRSIFFTGILFLILLIVPLRYGYNWILKKKMLTEKIVIMGTGEIARQLIQEIWERPDAGYQVVGVIPTSEHSSPFFMQDIPFCSMNGELNELIEQQKVSRIVVAMDEKRGKFPIKTLLRCKMNGIRVLEWETLYEELTGKLYVEKLSPSWLIFSEGFQKSWVTRLTKRLTGLIFAFVGLVLIFPFFCLVAIAIKLESKGPVFYQQNRCTENGKTFKIFKFRSMVDNAEALTGPQWAAENDPRITRVGTFLRRYRIDELPQIWNVLRGDMSFVGPRPERPEFVKQLSQKIPYYEERHSVKPGITGWAQVCYRYGASMDDALEKLKYDLFYVKNMSFALDLLILFRTIKIMLLQSGAR